MTNETPSPRKGHILIVDDNQYDLQYLDKLLSEHGYQVSAAIDGSSALNNAQEQTPNLVLMDVRMPGMDGYQVCRALKSNDLTRHIPVIFISGIEDHSGKIHGFSAGGVDFITKPYENSEVLARVEIHLAIARLQKQLEYQNADLQREIAERERAEAALIKANEELEKNIQERTFELLETNQNLREELHTRRETENALRDSEARYRNIIESSPMGMHFYQLEPDGRLVFTGANPAAEQILGVPQDQFIGMTIEAAFPALADTEVPKAYRQVAANGVGWKEEQVQYHEGRISGAFEVHAFQTEPGKMVATFMDITQRAQAESERERLLVRNREQAQQMSEIMDTVPEGVLLLDQNSYILHANPLAKKYLSTLTDATIGSKLDKLGNRPIQELLTPPPQGLKHEIQTGAYLFEILARPMMGDTVINHWVLVLREITKEREIQKSVQRQERLAAVGQLAAGIAHDFNNILAVIILYTDMLTGQADLPQKVRERIHTISEQAHLATGMIQQILDFSRRAILERHPMNLLPFVKEQVKLLERTLPENIKVELTYKEHEYLVNADPTRMQQTFMNLAVNARDAMPNGGKLHISMDRTNIPDPITCENCGQIMNGEWVHINLSDSGSGIPGEIMPRIFEPFFTTKEPGQGTGLGLSQVYGIIMQHEGHILVNPRADEGASFDIYLPILNAANTPVTLTDTGSLHTGYGELILVVEDEVATRKALEDSLTLLNYRVKAVNDGEQALDFIEKHGKELNLILSDVVMPEMGGITLFKTLREQRSTTPLILMTGHPMKEELHGLQSEGLAGWLQKPPKLMELSRIIAQVLASANT